MLKILQKNRSYLIAVLTVIVTILIALGIHNTKEPEQCALCGGLKYHAPCIVNLSTGEVGELAIYEPHPTLVGEIAEEQPGGTLVFFSCAGQKAVRDGDAQTCRVQLPEKHDTIKLKYFCHECRSRLSDLTEYAIVDLYDLEDIRAFFVEGGASYKIREYTISVMWDNEQEVFTVENSAHAPLIKNTAIVSG